MFPSSYSFLADSHGFQLQHIATYGYFVSSASIDPPPQNINLTVTASTLAHSRHRVTNIRPEIQSLICIRHRHLKVFVPASAIILIWAVILRLIRRLKKGGVLLALELGDPRSLDLLLEKPHPVEPCEQYKMASKRVKRST